MELSILVPYVAGSLLSEALKSGQADAQSRRDAFKRSVEVLLRAKVLLPLEAAPRRTSISDFQMGTPASARALEWRRSSAGSYKRCISGLASDGACPAGAGFHPKPGNGDCSTPVS